MTERPEAEIGDLTLLDEDEQRELLATFSCGGEPVTPASAGLLERFAAQVRTRPEQPAVVAGHTEVDYATLERRANRLANALISRGVRPNHVVGLHTGRTVELVVAVLGVLKAGAAYLPLDPGQPAERLAAMVTDAEPALVLTDLGDPVAGGRQLWEDLAAVEAEGTREDAPEIDADPTRLAYVIYTSGSTGRPKGWR
ncbi:AMP-binding protein [Streptomyces sp. M10(2022)]